MCSLKRSRKHIFGFVEEGVGHRTLELRAHLPCPLGAATDSLVRGRVAPVPTNSTLAVSRIAPITRSSRPDCPKNGTIQLYITHVFVTRKLSSQKWHDFRGFLTPQKSLKNHPKTVLRSDAFFEKTAHFFRSKCKFFGKNGPKVALFSEPPINSCTRSQNLCIHPKTYITRL